VSVAPAIGVVLEAFIDRDLDAALGFLQRTSPEVTHIEVGAGGYAPHPHFDPDLALVDDGYVRSFLDTLERYGITLDALNVWGNPLHPDAAIAAEHDAALRRAVRLAGRLGIDRIVAMAGCPGASATDTSPAFGAGGWLPYLEGVHADQWDRAVAPYWLAMDRFIRAENPDVLVCIELHPGTAVYNVETFEKFAALGSSLAANLDPSHFFWMQMDALAVTERIVDRIGHAHAKDVTFHAENLALNGLLDQRWPSEPEKLPWTFSAPGQGHDAAWWRAFCELLGKSQAKVLSIEHEDPFVSPETGVPDTGVFLSAAGAGRQEGR
jgi:sugar phosphate isomerase/epimerase